MQKTFFIIYFYHDCSLDHTIYVHPWNSDMLPKQYTVSHKDVKTKYVINVEWLNG